MIITCENCGKRHYIDPEQLREAMTTFQCDVCNHVMTFSIRANNPGDLPFPNPDPKFIDLTEQNEETTTPSTQTTKEAPPESGLENQRPVNQEKPERIDLAEQIEETTSSAPETTAEEPPESGPPPLTPDDPEDIDWEEVIKEATPSAPETKSEEPSMFGAPPLTPDDPEDIDWEEVIKEATPSAPETKTETPPESGFDEPGPVNQEKPKYINLAEEIKEVTSSAPEIKSEKPSMFGAPPLTPDDPEDIKWAEMIKETTPSAPETKREEPPESGFDEPWFVNQEKPKFIGVAEQNEETIPSAPETKREEPPEPAPHKMRMVGVRGKMFFLVIPICLIIAAVFIHRNSIKTLTGFIIKESSQLVTKMAENAIAEKGRFVAKEVERYLLSHPDLPKEDFIQDPVLKGIGVQKVGKTGYTYLISMRTPTEVSALWLHPDEKLIGKDVVTVMRNALGKEYERWNRIQGVAFTQGKEAAGYYTWHDKREKYMVMVPVEGTGFFVTSTALLDEYTAPMKQLEGRVNELTAAATRIMTIVLVAAALIIVLFFVIYNYPLSGRLKTAFDPADHIGVDDLEVETGRNKWGNERKVAPAIRRMQGSIHHAINRFRERR